MLKTGRECERRRREDKWHTFLCCRDQRATCRMAQTSAENLKQTWPAETERVASTDQSELLTKTSEPHLPKRKDTVQSFQITR